MTEESLEPLEDEVLSKNGVKDKVNEPKGP